MEFDPRGINNFILSVLQTVESNRMSVMLNVVFQVTYKEESKSLLVCACSQENLQNPYAFQ